MEPGKSSKLNPLRDPPDGISEVDHNCLVWELMSKDQRILWDTHILERVLPKFIGKSGMPEWDTWAENWVNGSDRSEETAQNYYDVYKEKCISLGSFGSSLTLVHLALGSIAITLGALSSLSLLLALKDYYGDEAAKEEHKAQMLDALEILK
jgi:hypothetical protein